MGNIQTVDMLLMVEKLNLKNLTPDIDLTGRKLASPEINRPAIQLSGYFEHFATERVQILGYVEYTYLQSRSDEEKKPIYERFLLQQSSPAWSTPPAPSRSHTPWKWRTNTTYRYSIPIRRLPTSWPPSSAG